MLASSKRRQLPHTFDSMASLREYDDVASTAHTLQAQTLSLGLTCPSDLEEGVSSPQGMMQLSEIARASGLRFAKEIVTSGGEDQTKSEKMTPSLDARVEGGLSRGTFLKQYSSDSSPVGLASRQGSGSVGGQLAFLIAEQPHSGLCQSGSPAASIKAPIGLAPSHLAAWPEKPEAGAGQRVAVNHSTTRRTPQILHAVGSKCLELPPVSPSEVFLQDAAEGGVFPTPAVMPAMLTEISVPLTPGLCFSVSRQSSPPSGTLLSSGFESHASSDGLARQWNAKSSGPQHQSDDKNNVPIMQTPPSLSVLFGLES